MAAKFTTENGDFQADALAGLKTAVAAAKEAADKAGDITAGEGGEGSESADNFTPKAEDITKATDDFAANMKIAVDNYNAAVKANNVAATHITAFQNSVANLKNAIFAAYIESADKAHTTLAAAKFVEILKANDEKYVVDGASGAKFYLNLSKSIDLDGRLGKPFISKAQKTEKDAAKAVNMQLSDSAALSYSDDAVVAIGVTSTKYGTSASVNTPDITLSSVFKAQIFAKASAFTDALGALKTATEAEKADKYKAVVAAQTELFTAIKEVAGNKSVGNGLDDSSKFWEELEDKLAITNGKVTYYVALDSTAKSALKAGTHSGLKYDAVEVLERDADLKAAVTIDGVVKGFDEMFGKSELDLADELYGKGGFIDKTAGVRAELADGTEVKFLADAAEFSRGDLTFKVASSALYEQFDIVKILGEKISLAQMLDNAILGSHASANHLHKTDADDAKLDLASVELTASASSEDGIFVKLSSSTADVASKTLDLTHFSDNIEFDASGAQTALAGGKKVVFKLNEENKYVLKVKANETGSDYGVVDILLNNANVDDKVAITVTNKATVKTGVSATDLSDVTIGGEASQTVKLSTDANGVVTIKHNDVDITSKLSLEDIQAISAKIDNNGTLGTANALYVFKTTTDTYILNTGTVQSNSGTDGIIYHINGLADVAADNSTTITLSGIHA